MPLAAYGGRADIMGVIAPDGPVYQAGTLSGNPVAVTAGLETLRILKTHPEIYTELDEKARILEEEFGVVGTLAVLAAFSILFEAMFVSAAHTADDIEDTVRAIESM